MSDPISDTKNDVPGSDGKRNRKDYERELARLHVEFVKLEQWVVHKGLERSKVVCGVRPWRVTDRPGILLGTDGYAIIGGLFVTTLLTPLFPPALYVAWFRIEEPRKEPEPSLGAGVPAPPNSDIIN